MPARKHKSRPKFLALPSTSNLSKLPVELLSEVLMYTNSPRDVLSVARTCKSLCYTLLLDTNQFIWRYCRKNCQPDPLPEPTQGFTEPGYAAFVFNNSNCEVCGGPAPLMAGSYALRLKLCPKKECKAALTSDSTPIITAGAPLTSEDFLMAFPGSPSSSFWEPHKARPYFHTLPRAETSDVFESKVGLSHSPYWPLNQTMLRTSDLSEAVREYLDESETPERFKEYVIRCGEKKQKNEEFMKLCVELYGWKVKYESTMKDIKKKNSEISRNIASRHGIKDWDLITTPSFGEVFRRRNNALERIVDFDYTVRQDTINLELVKIKDQRARRVHEDIYQKARASVEKHYNRLRAGKKEMPLPTLEVFRTIPIIAKLQKEATPDMNLDKDLQSAIISTLLHGDLCEWRKPLLEHFGVMVGGDAVKGWKNASELKLHPAQRVHARFRCTTCGKLGLDFAGVCTHICSLTGKKGKKSKWRMEMFEKDDKAIKAMTTVLTVCKINPDDVVASNMLKGQGSTILCESCGPNGIVMKPHTVVGHCHRHEDMKIRLLTTDDAAAVLQAEEYPVVPDKVTAKLLALGKRADKAKKMVVFGCRHCLRKREVTQPTSETAAPSATPAAPPTATAVAPVAASTTSSPPATTNLVSVSSVGGQTVLTTAMAATFGATTTLGTTAAVSTMTPTTVNPKKRSPLCTFDGMRSHLKAKHGVLDIRDEDLYCTKGDEVKKLCNM